MAVTPAPCKHEFELLKSPNTVIVWTCNTCHSGPHLSIYKCKHCKTVRCQPCTSKQ
ncbi:hypothetical protein BS50DRAFT_570711 [Corynespora cassiicola Philippines]|uniref:Uncharacterized protein n=1 Tax=Corynespora cassiicola Philippines TaxID=1448308 RepID=A0A2T2P1V5_CORCC|nr:hypothetical protein BS50DRAFT_570711 [Corynespora cassiicola Philippines]